MISIRLMSCAAAVALLSGAGAMADPAYVTSTVNLRADATTSSDILAKIPEGSLVDATNCSEWCQVDWQGKKGFAIASVLDRSGRVPSTRRAASAPRPAPEVYASDEYEPAEPSYYYAPPAYYYGYRPYYWGRPYGGYRYGYRRYRRW